MERFRLLVEGLVSGALLAATGFVAIIAGFVLVRANAEINPEMARMMRAVGLPAFSVSLVAFVSLSTWLGRPDPEEVDDMP